MERNSVWYERNRLHSHSVYGEGCIVSKYIPVTTPVSSLTSLTAASPVCKEREG